MTTSDRPRVGSDAIDFSLRDHEGNEFRLSDHRGRRIILSFHPLAWTSVCAKQMQMLDQIQPELKDLDTVAVGISVDSVPSKRAWAESIGVRSTPLLSDFWPHGKVARMYGVFDDDKGVASRANIIIGRRFKIDHLEKYETPDLPDMLEVLEIIRTMAAR